MSTLRKETQGQLNNIVLFETSMTSTAVRRAKAIRLKELNLILFTDQMSEFLFLLYQGVSLNSISPC